MKRRVGLSALVVLTLPLLAWAQQAPEPEFTVGDIRVEGLQRLTEGTVFNYLPVNIGDRLNGQRLREALRSLYATGFFRDVELRRDGSTLVVAVIERPSLESVEIKGNKDIKTEDLQKSLRQVGLSAGKTFNRSTLEEVTQYLTDQYYSRGKYAVSIDTKVEDLPNNRVRVNIDIKEGGRAKIRQINIVGNTKFKSKDILETLTLKTPSWSSWYKQDDRYSRESLQGDLEKIKSWYQDRGYANFRADSVQVAISPEKSDIFITVNITEGEVYKIGSVKLAGNTVVPERQLRRLLLVAPGQTYSQQTIAATQELIKNRLGAEGFYFARVEPVPTSDEANKTVDLTLFVDPGNRVYVHEITFTGSNRSNDETLRREMRQFEGALLSNIDVERSKQRLQRLSFIEEVDVETTPVPGSPDLVDVTFKVKERPSAQIGAEGFYFARVEPVPTSDEAKKTVDLTLFVDPGSRVYVHEIAFTGSNRSNDETLRREMRQLEGALLSNVAVERSKQRLQRLSFVEEVDVDTAPVPGSPDLVDVTFKVKERPSAQIGGGIGYSASQKFMLNANFSDSNFMGSGDAVSLQADAGQYNRLYSFVHTDPYVSVDGLSRSISLSYRDSTQFVSASSQFRSRNTGLGLTYGYPITEYQRVSAGLSLQNIDLMTYGGSSAQQAVDWVQQNGGPYARKVVSTVTQPDGTTSTALTTLYGSKYRALELTLGWLYDSRNRGLFADRGQRHTLGVVVTPPGSKVHYAIANYGYTGYLPLWRRWTLSFNANLAYGNAISSATALPPYKRFYAGGPDTVRGFVESTLGPIDTNGNPYGGNLLLATQTELILPLPLKWQTSARASVFFDMGNTFSTDGTKYVGRDLRTPVEYKFSYSELKQSAGIALEWLAPSLGIFRFSYGVALNDSAGDAVHFADRTESFQFTIGQSF